MVSTPVCRVEHRAAAARRGLRYPSDLTDEEFAAVIDSWRSDHIWKQQDGNWELRNAVWRDR